MIYDTFNNGRHLTDKERSGKLMLLSKTKEDQPDPEDTRPIVIMNTFNKLIQAVLIFITEERIMRFVGDYQLGFRKGSSTQHQIVRTMDYLRRTNMESRQWVLSFDISGAFDHVPQNNLIDLLTIVFKKTSKKETG